MDEKELRASIEMNKLQLSQVETALTAAGANADLEKLQSDLKELIQLSEESLLALMKSKLLAQIDAQSTTGAQSLAGAHVQASTSGQSTINLKMTSQNVEDTSDDESTSSDNDSSSLSRSASRDVIGELDASAAADDDFDQIIGSKCRAPHSHAWGGMTYHNAMIVAVLPLQENQEPKVRVMFTQPTHRSLVPCQYFLDDRCSYDEGCRFSHGHIVDVCELKEYIEPDHSELALESRCLAKRDDRVWYPATIVELPVDNNHQYKVMFEKNDDVMEVDVSDVAPMKAAAEGDDVGDDDVVSNDGDGDSLHATSGDDDDDVLPVYLWRPGQCNDVMAGWEKHTKGIGSKLMIRQGYVMGQGLGRNQEGRAEPVPIQLLPVGKSLDKIMELKELAGNRDLYDVMKKQKRKQKKIDANASESYQKKKKVNVFEFINKKLGEKHEPHHGKSSHGVGKSTKTKQARHITKGDLKSKTEKNLNIQLFQTAQEIRSTEREIQQLKNSIARNQSEPLVMRKMAQKLVSLEKYVKQLKSSESCIQSHKQTRRDNKKLSIF